MSVQMVAAEKLAQSPPVSQIRMIEATGRILIAFVELQEMFDVLLDENQLDDACDHLADYLQTYWNATHPQVSSPPQIRKNRPQLSAPSSPVPTGSERHTDL